METIEYTILDSPDHPGWGHVAEMFARMYHNMDGMGLMLPLAGDGAEKWLKMAKNTSGKFGIVVVARHRESTIGFAHGILKFLPDYLGGYPVGSITHVFVDEKIRNAGVGKQLVKRLEDWFHMKKVHSIELQVIQGNLPAKEFWIRLGYPEELIQYRKITKP